MQSNTLCKLCYNPNNKETINIFDNNGINLNIVQILKKHFWFKIIENINNNFICTNCWSKTEQFDKFYNIVELVHNNVTFNNINNNNNLKTTSTIKHHINQEYCNLDDVEIKMIKLENYQNNSETKNTYENENNTIYKNEPVEHILIESDVTDNISNLDGHHNIKDDAEVDNNDGIYNENKQLIKTIQPPTRKRIGNYKFNKNVSKIKIKKKKISITNFEKDLDEIENEEAQIRDYFKMECDICKCKFQKFLEAKAHYRTEHKTRGYLLCCNRKYFHRGTVLDHIAFHVNPESFKCRFCNKIYNDRYVLNNHIDLIHVKSESKPFKCNVCPKTYTKQFQLTQHLKYGHLSDDDKKFTCNECAKIFISKYNLAAHIKSVHQNKCVFICDICAVVFKRKNMLENHRKTHFPNEPLPKSQCNICAAWLKNQNSLRTHLLQHEIDKKKCPTCGKETVNKEALRNHIKYVHAEKKHICKMCNRGFKKPVELREHTATHTGEILYSCQYCPKTFTCGPNMRSHRKKMHPIEWQKDKES